MKKLLIYLIKLYQKYLSPDHSFWAKKMNKPPYCKHIPSCSDYMIESIKKKWVFVWVQKWIWRILRCQPFFKWGYDPVEKNNSTKKKISSHSTWYIGNGILKYEKTVTFFCIIVIFYMFLIIYAQKIETLATFPATSIEFKNPFWNIKTNFDYEEINIKSSNWYNINGLYVKALSWSYNINEIPKTVYYFHWNGWPIDYFYSELEYISSLWYNVFAYDFPWYWKSEWYPYKKNIEIFSRDFYEYIKKEKGLKDNELIIWWFSVWAWVAIDFANNYDYEKLVLISPFSSRYDMWIKIFWFNLPKILFLKNSFVSEQVVQNFNKPVLVIHSNNDKIIPFEQWLKVYNNYWYNYIKEGLSEKITKNFIEIDNFWHNWIINNYWEILKFQFLDFLKTWKIETSKIFLDNKKIEELKQNNIKLEQERKIKSLDLTKDDSLTKFVNNKIHFNKLGYVPENLESINSNYIFDTKWNSKLTQDANIALQNLAKDFYKEFSRKLSIVSAYRSYNYQVGIKNGWCPDNLCAKPWFSEHQSWLAVDIFSASTQYEWKINPQYQKYFEWFKENAYKYWFHNTYQKWPQIDWYEIEPWHWRYLWIDLATYLKDEGITVAEFYERIK
jgi:putative membrane protein insertion efficiency factor